MTKFFIFFYELLLVSKVQNFEQLLHTGLTWFSLVGLMEIWQSGVTDLTLLQTRGYQTQKRANDSI